MFKPELAINVLRQTFLKAHTRVILKSVFTFLTITFLTVTAIGQQHFMWPDNKKCAVVLTYDDGLASQLQVAIPQLDSAKLKGTFFLNGTLTDKAVVQWQD